MFSRALPEVFVVRVPGWRDPSPFQRLGEGCSYASRELGSIDVGVTGATKERRVTEQLSALCPRFQGVVVIVVNRLGPAASSTEGVMPQRAQRMSIDMTTGLEKLQQPHAPQPLQAIVWRPLMAWVACCGCCNATPEYQRLRKLLSRRCPIWYPNLHRPHRRATGFQDTGIAFPAGRTSPIIAGMCTSTPRGGCLPLARFTRRYALIPYLAPHLFQVPGMLCSGLSSEKQAHTAHRHGAGRTIGIFRRVPRVGNGERRHPESRLPGGVSWRQGGCDWVR